MPTIAVVDFSSINAPGGEAVALTGFVRSATVRCGKFRVVDRGNMEKILAEQAFQQTGCTSQECAVKMGKILNVHKIVVGEYLVMGGVKFLTASLVDVESGVIERTGRVRGFGAGEADKSAGKLVAQLTGEARSAYEVARVETPGDVDTVAVLDLAPVNAPSGEAVAITGFIRAAMVRSGKFRVVDRNNMEKLLAEQSFQQAGCTSSECAVKMGRILNVGKMVVGEYSVIDGVRYMTASLLVVETGVIERTGKLKGFEVEGADDAADELVAQLTGAAPAPYEEFVLASSVQKHPLNRGRFGVALGFMLHPNEESTWLRGVEGGSIQEKRKEFANTTGSGCVSFSYRSPFQEGMKWGSGVDAWLGYGPRVSGIHESDSPSFDGVFGIGVGAGVIVYRNVLDLVGLYLGGGVSSYLDPRANYTDEYGNEQSMHVNAGKRFYARGGVEYFIGTHLSIEVEGQYGSQQTKEFPANEPNQVTLKYNPMSFSGFLRYSF